MRNSGWISCDRVQQIRVEWRPRLGEDTQRPCCLGDVDREPLMKRIGQFGHSSIFCPLENEAVPRHGCVVAPIRTPVKGTFGLAPVSIRRLGPNLSHLTCAFRTYRISIKSRLQMSPPLLAKLPIPVRTRCILVPIWQTWKGDCLRG